MKAPFKLALTATLLSGIALATPASATDKELLNTLLENGVLTKAQHEKLISQADEKPSKMTSSSLKDMDWASRIKISGDLRVRHEDKQTDAKGVRESRQRIRARLAIAAKINDEVEVITLSGVVKINDISSSNSVYSYQIANAKLTYKGKGTSSEGQRPGLLARVLNWLM